MLNKQKSQQPSAKRKQRVRKSKVSQRVKNEQIVRREMGRGTNPMSEELATAQTSQIVSIVDQKLDIKASYTPQSLSLLATGIVLSAVKRGWLVGNPDVSSGDVYFAFRYLIEIFENTMNNKTLILQAAPVWFWELLAALKPKTVNFKTGTIAYTWEKGPDQGFSVSLAVSPTSVIFFGAADPVNAGDVNGFPILSAPSQPYDSELGSAALSKMWGYLAQQGSPLGKVGAEPAKLVLARDASAFAMIYGEFGASFLETAGVYNTIQSETPLTAPLFSKFSQYNSIQYRASQYYRRSIGGPCAIGPMLMSYTDPLQMKNKVSPIIKHYNFDDFVQRLAFTLISAIQKASEIAATKIDPVLYTCPLSTQQFQIMLRQSLLPHFDNEYAQDVYWQENALSPIQGTVNFYPFIVGPNGVAITSTTIQPKFPKFFAEFVRGATGFTLPLKRGGFIRWLSVLGRNPSAPVIPNYKYEVAGTSAVLFSDTVQAPINLIDASFVSGNQTGYVDLNGLEYNKYVTSWNNWITGIPTLMALTQVGESRPCQALRANIWTQLLRTEATQTLNGKPVVPVSAQSKRKTLGTKMELSLRANPSPTETDYTSTVAIVGLTGNNNFPSPLLKFLNAMFLPVFWTNSDAQEGSTTAYQANAIEPYYLPSSNGPLGNLISTVNAAEYVNMYQKNLTAASIDVKATSNNSLSEMEVELDKLTTSGYGGFFTELVANIADGFGGKGIGDVARVVGKITGI